MTGTLRIAIVGDGVVAALAGAMLSRAGAEIVRVPTGGGGTGLGPFGNGVVALPDVVASATESAIGRVAGTSFSLGIAFGGWARGGASWFLPFGDTGAPLGSIGFIHLASRLRAQGHDVRLADFSLAAMAAQAGRYAPPADDPRSPLSTLAAGAHYPAAELARAFDRLEPTRTVAALCEVRIDNERISSLTLVDGFDVQADLYVDATGEDALLRARLPGDWESWQEWLPCNRCLVQETPEPLSPPPYAFHTAQSDGWSATTPLDGLRVESRFSVDGPGKRYDNGVRRAAWFANCVSVGAAAGIVEPVLGTPLLLAHDAVARLIALLPSGHDHAIEAAEYNRLTVGEHERVRDGAVALWATNGRFGEPLWDGPRDKAPDTLGRKLKLFASRGRVPIYDDEPFTRADWIAILDGQGIRPRRIDPLASALGDEAIRAHAGRLRDRLTAAVRTMPSHAEQIERYRSARP